MKENLIQVPDFRKANFEELRALVNNVNWDALKTLNVEEAWVKFKNSLKCPEGLHAFFR